MKAINQRTKNHCVRRKSKRRERTRPLSECEARSAKPILCIQRAAVLRRRGLPECSHHNLGVHHNFFPHLILLSSILLRNSLLVRMRKIQRTSYFPLVPIQLVPLCSASSGIPRDASRDKDTLPLKSSSSRCYLFSRASLHTEYLISSTTLSNLALSELVDSKSAPALPSAFDFISSLL